MPATSLVAQLFASLEAEGLREGGTQALVKTLQKLGNVSVVEGE
jgi:hypothetical protein